MVYPILASLFFLSLILLVVGAALIFLIKIDFKWACSFWRKHKGPLSAFYVLWILGYGLFILFFTGPINLNVYPKADGSPYKLPWQEGVERFVSQGNRSFTSHRDSMEFSWDFWMPIGTEVLASRAGTVIDVEQNFDGIGLKSNYIKIRHADGTIALYAHIKHLGSLVRTGDTVYQGQPIAMSGMVGQTVNPHLHFAVFNAEDKNSIPIAFADVPEGVPMAGRFYISGNFKERPKAFKEATSLLVKPLVSDHSVGESSKK